MGLVAGTLHDVGCALVEHYAETQRVVRHAEGGALLLQEILPRLLLSEKQKILICYAVAAHTHYLKPQTVGEDTIEPYLDTSEGEPLWGILFTRWVDRLDCNGAGFVGRHYLTLARAHQDFDGKQFYGIEFAEHL